eukprot:UN10951
MLFFFLLISLHIKAKISHLLFFSPHSLHFFPNHHIHTNCLFFMGFKKKRKPS